jgi:hypothetical protein
MERWSSSSSPQRLQSPKDERSFQDGHPEYHPHSFPGILDSNSCLNLFMQEFADTHNKHMMVHEKTLNVSTCNKTDAHTTSSRAHPLLRHFHPRKTDSLYAPTKFAIPRITPPGTNSLPPPTNRFPPSPQNNICFFAPPEQQISSSPQNRSFQTPKHARLSLSPQIRNSPTNQGQPLLLTLPELQSPKHPPNREHGTSFHSAQNRALFHPE